jgi:hypothetical protein
MAAIIGVPVATAATGHDGWFVRVCPAKTEASRIHLTFSGGRQGFTRFAFLTIVDRILPALRQLERIVRPRAGWLAGPWARVPVGIICLVLAIVITLPVPLGHLVPGTAISVLALGLIERDGIAVALGIFTAVVGLLVVIFASAGLLNAARLWQG